MNHSLEKQIINICNTWKENLDPVNETLSNQYSTSKHKLRNLYLQKTGEFLKLSQAMESKIFSNIVTNLEKNHKLSDELIDNYLLWCFNNQDFFIEKYKEFSLVYVARFANEWHPNLFDVELDKKITLDDLKNLTVSTNILLYCEKFGIPLVSTKLQKDLKLSKNKTEELFIAKLNSLTQNTNDLKRLKKMLLRTVENAPYSVEILFSDYKKSLNDLFLYFAEELWSQI